LAVQYKQSFSEITTVKIIRGRKQRTLQNKI